MPTPLSDRVCKVIHQRGKRSVKSVPPELANNFADRIRAAAFPASYAVGALTMARAMATALSGVST